MNTQNQNMPGNVQAASTAQISQQQMRDAYWNAPLPYAPTNGPAPVMPAAVVNQDHRTKANTFSKLSVAFIVLGLVLLGASIVPFVVYFDLPAALGVLAFDTLLMASALVFTMLGIIHSSQIMRRTGLILGIRSAHKGYRLCCRRRRLSGNWRDLQRRHEAHGEGRLRSTERFGNGRQLLIGVGYRN